MIEKETSRFSRSNFYSNLSNNDGNSESNDEISNSDPEEKKNTVTDSEDIESEDNESEDDETKLKTNVKRFFVQPKIGPIKMAKKVKPGNKISKAKSSTESKRLESSAGFTSKPTQPKTSDPNEKRSRREAKPRDKFEPNFEPIYKRNKPALSVQSDEDDVNLDPTAMNCEQLMSCMEQDLVQDKSKLNSREEQEIYNNLLDLSSPDPKSQSAIDKMPEEKRKRYNDATIK